MSRERKAGSVTKLGPEEAGLEIKRAALADRPLCFCIRELSSRQITPYIDDRTGGHRFFRFLEKLFRGFGIHVFLAAIITDQGWNVFEDKNCLPSFQSNGFRTAFDMSSFFIKPSVRLFRNHAGKASEKLNPERIDNT